jgi:hypothetical protein
MSLEVALLVGVLQIFFIVICKVKLIILCEFALLTETLLSALNNHFNGTSGTNKVMNGNRFITRPLLLICVKNFPVIHT